MDFKQILAARLKAVKDAALAALPDRMVVPTDVRDRRLAICDTCEFLFAPTKQCKKCGCFLKMKTSFADFKCPIDKWPAENQ